MLLVISYQMGQKFLMLKSILTVVFDFFSEVAPFGITVTVNCPPDTDTPGLQEEAKYKPEETKLISESAGLFKPEDVARFFLYS